MAYQDMAGIDVVQQQIRPGLDTGSFRWIGGMADAEFFHYGLAKLGASLGHIDPTKAGQIMCEIFGAYGWSEGSKLMKWLLDHMLVRGVNTYVPHAYSPKSFPDPDCPPHFWAWGHNPQHRFFGDLIRYGQRICHLFSDGKPILTAAILYHGEAEWFGEAMLCQKPMRVLMQAQIDADFVPCDAFDPENPYKLEQIGSQIKINGVTFHCLVVPAAKALPAHVIRFIAKAQRIGFPIYFIQRRPSVVLDCDSTEEAALLGALRSCPVVTLATLVQTLQGQGLYDIRTRTYESSLRTYHYRRGSMDSYMFFNENPNHTVTTTVILHQQGTGYQYDAMANTLTALPLTSTTEGIRLPLHLMPYQSMVLLFDQVSLDTQLIPYQERLVTRQTTTPDIHWTVAYANAVSYPNFGEAKPLEKLESMAMPQHFPNQAGTFRYRSVFEYSSRYNRVELDLGQCYETVEAWLNGKFLGRRLTPPYRFDVTGCILDGKNHLTVEVTGTLVQEVKDRFSAFSQIEPVGLLGNVTLLEG